MNFASSKRKLCNGQKKIFETKNVEEHVLRLLVRKSVVFEQKNFRVSVCVCVFFFFVVRGKKFFLRT